MPVKRECILPPKPAHGDHFLVYGPNDVLIALQYLCFQPYELSGNSQRTCLPNNTWSGTPPVCSQGLTQWRKIMGISDKIDESLQTLQLILLYSCDDNESVNESVPGVVFAWSTNFKQKHFQSSADFSSVIMFCIHSE